MSAVIRNIVLPWHKRDVLLDWVQELLNHSFVLNNQGSYVDSLVFVENLIREHITNPQSSRLKEILPSIGKIFTNLPLCDAFKILDTTYAISKRRFMRPSFNEIRRVFNLAQIMFSSKRLKLACFDGDITLYEDGKNFNATENPSLAKSLSSLLCDNVHVALVTAAGYGLNNKQYEVRLRGLFDYFAEIGLTNEQIGRFYVLGGECNYLLRAVVVGNVVELSPIALDQWRTHLERSSPWSVDEIKTLLDAGERILLEAKSEFNMKSHYMRKERAIGLYPALENDLPGSVVATREVLEEIVYRVKYTVAHGDLSIKIPFCVFNGGRDVWLDIGNKGIGVDALYRYLGFNPDECLHFGDQFSNNGNDIAVRTACPSIWITSPQDTSDWLIKILDYRKRN